MFTQFYHGTTRKLIILFGTLFNNIVIDRTDDNGNVVQKIRVPLSHAPKDKVLARLTQDPALDKEAAITLPRMSFEQVDIEYDGDRKRNTVGHIARKDSDVNKFRHIYNPVPFNFHFNLYIYVKNAEDATKIYEQILPYFTPEWAVTLNMIPEMNILEDVVIVLNGVKPQDHYDGQFINRRALVWTLSFTIKSHLYGPIRKKPVIKIVDTDFYIGNDPSDGSEVVDRITVTPGLTANGDPTTDPNETISPLLIDVDDDWDYIIQQSGLVIVEDEN